MSYIPKYILKRMLPKTCCKAVDGGLEITAVNVISPIGVEEIPDNVVEYFDIILDGTAQDNAVKEKIKLTVDDKAYDIANAKDLVGQTIAVGAQFKIFAPIPLAAGEEHEVEVVIKTDNPMNIKVKRTIQ